MEHQGKSKTRIAQVTKMYKTKEYSECTYKPKINKSCKKSSRKGLPNRVSEILENRERKREILKKREQKNKEKDLMENCTFAPKINKRASKQKNNQRIKNRREMSKDEEIFCLELEEEENPFFDRRRNLSKRRRSMIPQTSRGGEKSKDNNKSISPLKKKPQRSLSAFRNNRSKSNQRSRKFMKKPTKLMMSATNNPKKKKRRPADPGIFTKRSIVVLNENDEFEDLNIYLEKKRKAMENKIMVETQDQQLLNIEKILREPQPQKEKEKSPKFEKVEFHQKIQERRVLGELFVEGSKQKVKKRVVKKQIKQKLKKVKKKKKSQVKENIIDLLDKENNFQGNLLDQRTVPVYDDEVEYNYTETNTVCELSKLKLSVIESPKKSESDIESSRNNQIRRDFLIINGEKIFFNEATISSIIDTNRIKKLAQCFGQYK